MKPINLDDEIKDMTLHLKTGIFTESVIILTTKYLIKINIGFSTKIKI